MAYEIGIMEDDVLLIRAIGKLILLNISKGYFNIRGTTFLLYSTTGSFWTPDYSPEPTEKSNIAFWDQACYENEQGKNRHCNGIGRYPDILIYAYKDNKFEKIPFGNHLLVNP